MVLYLRIFVPTLKSRTPDAMPRINVTQGVAPERSRG
jgi:hypothetical protein